MYEIPSDSQYVLCCVSLLQKVYSYIDGNTTQLFIVFTVGLFAGLRPTNTFPNLVFHYIVHKFKDLSDLKYFTYGLIYVCLTELWQLLYSFQNLIAVSIHASTKGTSCSMSDFHVGDQSLHPITDQ